MGAAGSVITGGGGDSVEDRVTKLIPPYYIPNAVVSPDDLAACKESWTMIVEDNPLVWTKDEEGSHQSCLSFFFDQFYVFSAEMDPTAGSLYSSGIRIQAKALTGMISMIFSMFKSDQPADHVEISLKKLAHGHFGRGVRSHQYPLVGEIFIKTMEYCLKEAYTDAIKIGWINIFSVIFRYVVPAAIKEEDLNRSKPESATTPVDNAMSRSITPVVSRATTPVVENITVTLNGLDPTINSSSIVVT